MATNHNRQKEKNLEYFIQLAREVGVLVTNEESKDPIKFDALRLRVAKRFNGVYLILKQVNDLKKSINALFACDLEHKNPSEFRHLLESRCYCPDEISNNFYEQKIMRKIENHGGIPQYLTSIR